MNSENTSDDASKDLDDFANLTDIIPPKVKNQSISAEYLISDNFLVPGIITHYFDDQLLFKPNFSDEIFNVQHNQIRHSPNIAIDCKYEVGNKVEVFMLNTTLNLHGWARSTVKSIVKNTYVVILEQRNSLVVVQRDKIRTITTGGYLNNRYLYTLNVPVPEELQNFASNIEVHDFLCKRIGNPHIRYDFENNALVISSNNINCQSSANMFLSLYFTNLTQIMLLKKSVKESGEKFQRMKTINLFEQFQIHPDLLGCMIGKNGKNIRKAEAIPGVLFIAVLRHTNTVKIYGQDKAALKEACEYLKLEKETIQISSQMISRVIGKKGQNIQEIADKSKLHHVKIIPNENSSSEVTELELVGTQSSIDIAKLLLKFHLYNLRVFKELVETCREVNKPYNTVFGDKNTKLSSRSPAVGASSYELTGREIAGRYYNKSIKFSTNVNGNKSEPELIKFTGNENLIFYNKNLSRGRAGIFLGRNFGGQFGYPTTQSRVDDSESKNSTSQNRESQSGGLAEGNQVRVKQQPSAKAGAAKNPKYVSMYL